MASDSYRPRIAAELRPDQHIRLQAIIPHGMQKHLFQSLVDGILELYDKGGMEAIGAIISSHISIQQLAAAGKPYTEKIMRDTY